MLLQRRDEVAHEHARRRRRRRGFIADLRLILILILNLIGGRRHQHGAGRRRERVHERHGHEKVRRKLNEGHVFREVLFALVRLGIKAFSLGVVITTRRRKGGQVCAARRARRRRCCLLLLLLSAPPRRDHDSPPAAELRLSPNRDVGRPPRAPVGEPLLQATQRQGLFFVVLLRRVVPVNVPILLPLHRAMGAETSNADVPSSRNATARNKKNRAYECANENTTLRGCPFFLFFCMLRLCTLGRLDAKGCCLLVASSPFSSSSASLSLRLARHHVKFQMQVPFASLYRICSEFARVVLCCAVVDTASPCTGPFCDEHYCIYGAIDVMWQVKSWWWLSSRRRRT